MILPYSKSARPGQTSRNQVLFGMSLFWAVLIAMLCFLPASALPTVPSLINLFADKVVHGVLYCILVWLVLKWHSERRGDRLTPTGGSAGIFAICFAYGWLLEVLQPVLTVGRSYEWSDVGANLAGCLAGLQLYRWTRRVPVVTKNAKHQ